MHAVCANFSAAPASSHCLFVTVPTCLPAPCAEFPPALPTLEQHRQWLLEQQRVQAGLPMRVGGGGGLQRCPLFIHHIEMQLAGVCGKLGGWNFMQCLPTRHDPGLLLQGPSPESLDLLPGLTSADYDQLAAHPDRLA